jgi:hypothetical protein
LFSNAIVLWHVMNGELLFSPCSLQMHGEGLA